MNVFECVIFLFFNATTANPMQLPLIPCYARCLFESFLRKSSVLSCDVGCHFVVPIKRPNDLGISSSDTHTHMYSIRNLCNVIASDFNSAFEHSSATLIFHRIRNGKWPIYLNVFHFPEGTNIRTHPHARSHAIIETQSEPWIYLAEIIRIIFGVFPWPCCCYPFVLSHSGFHLISFRFIPFHFVTFHF